LRWGEPAGGHEVFLCSESGGGEAAAVVERRRWCGEEAARTPERRWFRRQHCDGIQVYNRTGMPYAAAAMSVDRSEFCRSAPGLAKGRFVSTEFSPDGNDRYYTENQYIQKINIDYIEIRIYSGSRTNLPIMISMTTNQRAGLIPHLLPSGLILSLLMFIS
jgi:hypothetical protein